MWYQYFDSFCGGGIQHIHADCTVYPNHHLCDSIWIFFSVYSLHRFKMFSNNLFIQNSRSLLICLLSVELRAYFSRAKLTKCLSVEHWFSVNYVRTALHCTDSWSPNNCKNIVRGLYMYQSFHDIWFLIWWTYRLNMHDKKSWNIVVCLGRNVPTYFAHHDEHEMNEL